MSTDNAISVSADAMAHSHRVCSFLRDQIIKQGGWLPFSAWMHHALYAPGLGYYAACSVKLADNTPNAKRLTGDFITAPELTPLFGQTLANQVAEILSSCESLNVLEFGAGTGALADDVLTHLDLLGIKAQYTILEVSADLKARQQTRLASWGDRIRWLDQAPTAFIGCVLANEVLDAMPVDVFAWSLPTEEGANPHVLQRGIALNKAANPDAQFVWQDRLADTSLAETIAQRCPAMPGYQSEINLRGEAWIKETAGWLTKGAAILIDYGFPRSEYYHPQRHRGTLMCHIQHRAHDNPFLAPGLQDITAHVDFTAMADAALASGLDVLGYTSQARFLINAGLTELIMSRQRDEGFPVQARMTMNNAVQKLISEAEMGELFKVLVIGRGLEPSLMGFSRGDRRHQL